MRVCGGVPHVLLQGTRLIDCQITCTWAVSIYAIETFLRAIAEKTPVLANVGAFGAVFSRSVVWLSTDMASDIFRGAAALIRRMRQDVTSAALFKGDEAGGKVYG